MTFESNNDKKVLCIVNVHKFLFKLNIPVHRTHINVVEIHSFISRIKRD